MDMAKYYTLGEDSRITGLKVSKAFSAESDMKTCPSRRASLRNIQRYSRLTHRAVLDESSKRFIVWSTHEYLQLEAEFVRVQETFLDATIQCSVQSRIELIGTSANQFSFVNRCQTFSKASETAMSLRRAIASHVKNVQEEEQPLRRVRTLVEDARRRKKVSLAHMPEEIQTVQMGQSVRAAALKLRVDVALLANSSLSSKTRSTEWHPMGNRLQSTLQLTGRNASNLSKQPSVPIYQHNKQKDTSFIHDTLLSSYQLRMTQQRTTMMTASKKVRLLRM